MYEYYLTFRSLTRAQQAMTALKDRGLRSVLIRSPKIASDYGCGYALKLTANSVHPAVRLLQKLLLHPERVFSVSAEGLVQEVSM